MRAHTTLMTQHGPCWCVQPGSCLGLCGRSSLQRLTHAAAHGMLQAQPDIITQSSIVFSMQNPNSSVGVSTLTLLQTAEASTTNSSFPYPILAQQWCNGTIFGASLQASAQPDTTWWVLIAGQAAAAPLAKPARSPCTHARLFPSVHAHTTATHARGMPAACIGRMSPVLHAV